MNSSTRSHPALARHTAPGTAHRTWHRTSHLAPSTARSTQHTAPSTGSVQYDSPAMNSRPADPGALVAALAWAVGTWAALGTVALTGDGTTSRLGLLPPVWLLFALAAVACGAVYALRLSAPAAAPLWLALVALLPRVPGPSRPRSCCSTGRSDGSCASRR